MISLDENNGLFYTFDDMKIDVSKLYDKGVFYEENLQLYPGLSYEVERPSFKLKFKYKKIEFNLFINGIKYNLLDKSINGVFYSFTHLQEILKKYNLKNPIYRQKSKNEFLSLENPEKIEKFNFLDEIIIKEKKDDEEYNKIYDSMNTIYNKDNLNIFKKSIQLKLLSVNFNKYFSNNNIEINLDKQLPIFKSSSRFAIFYEVEELLKKKDKIFAICGPFGIEKSFTSLILQKNLYLINKNTLYVNLANNVEISNLKETLIKESFFLNLTKKKFVSLANKILNYKVNNIWDIISLIDNYCKEEKIDYLLILDQYKSKRDPKGNLSLLKVNHIFLLSSINDKDVKENLVSQIKGDKDKDLKFKYIYYISLGLNDFIQFNSDDYDENIIKCLKDFNYLPFTIFSLENIYDINILEFYNYQYKFALKKLSKFYNTYNISYLSDLFTLKKINDSKTNNPRVITKEEFLNNINDIPLKFISYQQQANKNYFALYYAFGYAKYPIENEVNNYIAKQRFNTKAEGSLKGGEFENIIKHKFILDSPLFEIDSFIIVDKIINMKFTDEFKNMKVEHLKQKKCVFISQSDFYGKDYDFAILYPEKKEIILIQAKYKLTNANCDNKSYYSDSKRISIITNTISQILGINIEKLFILYLSSVEYNYQRKDEVLKILKSKKINCLFYSINEEYFTYDFGNNLSIFLPTKSMEIYPESNIYEEQIFIKRRRTNELLFSFMMNEQKSNYEDKFISNEYDKFMEFLKSCSIKEEIKKNLGNFETPFSNNYRAIPNYYFANYILFFKLGPNSGIDFKKELILAYDDNISLVYYDIKSDKVLKNFSLKDNKNYKNYYFVVGKWKENKTINLEEKEI